MYLRTICPPTEGAPFPFFKPLLSGLGYVRSAPEVQRNAPVQLVRTWLNMALPRDARPLKDREFTNGGFSNWQFGMFSICTLKTEPDVL